MLGGELYLRLGTVLKPTLDLVLHGSSGDRCVIVGEGWEAVKECSDSRCGTCRRAALISSLREAQASRCGDQGAHSAPPALRISASGKRGSKTGRVAEQP